MKKYLFGLFAMSLALATSAFTSPKHLTADLYWFTPDTAGNPQDSEDIPPQDENSPFGCSTGEVRCALGYSNVQLVGDHYEPVAATGEPVIENKATR